jgi:acylphosphatase
MSHVATECARRHCYFAGRVQGVGFRYTARNIAINYDVGGFVRNLPDGRVELVAEGPPKEVEGFVEAVLDRMRTYIQQVDQREEPAAGDQTHFVISR